MNDKNKKIIKFIVTILIIFGCILYLWTKKTYTSYESLTNASSVPDIAGWNITINDKLITTKESKSISINDITWENNHVAEGKVAPGSKGILNIHINPKNTDVSIKYELEIIDKSINNSKILTVNNIKSTNSTLSKEKDNIYTGIISLDDIKNEKIIDISIELEWLNDDNVNDSDKNISSMDDYLTINFKASQYKG